MADQHSNERPLPPLATPNLVTIHDLDPEEREHIEIFKPGQALQWRWKDGYQPKEVGYARPLR